MEWSGHLPRVKRTNVVAEAGETKSIAELDEKIVACTACPRLVRWRPETQAHSNHNGSALRSTR